MPDPLPQHSHYFNPQSIILRYTLINAGVFAGILICISCEIWPYGIRLGLAYVVWGKIKAVVYGVGLN